MRNFLNSLFFFCLFCFPLKGQINLQDGIVAAFPINEGTVIDESGSNNDCNLPDGVTLIENRIGIPNSALMFDGNSYLECGPPNALDDLSIPVSLSFWYKVTEGDIGDFLPILFTDDNNGNSGNYYGFFSFFQNQKFWFGYGDGTGSVTQDRRGLLSDSLLLSDVWTNVIGTIDEDKHISLYINGVGAGGTQNGSSSLNVAHNENYPIRIGLRSRYGPFYFKGALDEVYLWNRVLNSDEIQEIVGGGLITKTRNIVNSNLRIYPNPASDQILISGLRNIKQKNIYFEMVDLYGQVVKSGKLDAFKESRLNVADVPQGSYFFRFVTEKSIESSGVIILLR